MDVAHLGIVEGGSGPVVIHGDSQRIAVFRQGGFLSVGGGAIFSVTDLARFKKIGGAEDAAFSRNGEYLATVFRHSGNYAIGNWGLVGGVDLVETGQRVAFRGLRNNKNGIQGSDLVEFSADGSLMALSGAGAYPRVDVVDVASIFRNPPRSEKASTGFSVLMTIRPKGLWDNLDLEWSPSGEFLAHVANIREGNMFQVGSHSIRLLLWRLSKGGSASLTISHFGTVLLDKAVSGDRRRERVASPYENVAFAPDSNLLAIAGSKKVPVRLVDVSEAKIVYSIPYDGTLVTAMTFTPGGRYLVTGDSDGSFRLWELGKGEFGVSLQPVDSAWLPGSVLAFAITPQGSAIVATTKDKGHLEISRVSLPSDRVSPEEVLASCTRGTATITTAMALDKTVRDINPAADPSRLNDRVWLLSVEVTLAGRAPFTAEFEDCVPLARVSSVTPGVKLAVVVNESDRNQVAIDWDQSPVGAGSSKPGARAGESDTVAPSLAPAEASATATAAAPTPTLAAPTWAPTHLAPPGGMATWDAPDARLAPVGHLPGSVELVVEVTAGAWARVRAANGWRGWVDNRLLALRR